MGLENRVTEITDVSNLIIGNEYTIERPCNRSMTYIFKGKHDNDVTGQRDVLEFCHLIDAGDGRQVEGCNYFEENEMIDFLHENDWTLQSSNN